MIRAQVQLEERQYEAIRRLAHRHRLSFAAAIRRLVDIGIKEGFGTEAKGDRLALLELAGVAASGLPDLGRRHDDYLVPTPPDVKAPEGAGESS